MPQKTYLLTDFLPTTKKELEIRGWDEVDIVFFTGDAYIDHPAFGAAVIGRIIEAEGLKVAIVPQPNWRDDLRDFKKMGRPRLFFAVSGGNMDSMVNHYTANKRLRSDDAYSPDGKQGLRPDYATITYCKILKKLYPDVPLLIGGIEASLRRFTHYDYWSDKLMPSILVVDLWKRRKTSSRITQSSKSRKNIRRTYRHSANFISEKRSTSLEMDRHYARGS